MVLITYVIVFNWHVIFVARNFCIYFSKHVFVIFCNGTFPGTYLSSFVIALSKNSKKWVKTNNNNSE